MSLRSNLLTASLIATAITAAPLPAAAQSVEELMMKGLLGPVCDDAKKRADLVAKRMKQGEYEQQSAQYEMDLWCEQAKRPATPVHDTADPANEATHLDWVQDAHWSPDGRFIVTAGRDKSVRIWEFATGKTVKRFDIGAHPPEMPATMQGSVRSARYLDDKRIVVTADGHPVRVLDAATGEVLGTIPYIHPDPSWDMPPFIRTHASGLVVLAGHGGEIVVYDVAAGKERYRLPGAPEEYPYIAVARDAPVLTVVLPGIEGTVLVDTYDLATGKPIWETQVKSGKSFYNTASGVALSRDGSRVAVDISQITSVLDIKAKQEIARIAAHPYFMGRNTAFTADGKGVISGVNSAVLLDVASSKRVHAFGPFTDNFHAADISPDGKYLVTGHLGSDARIWEVATGTFVRRLGKDLKPPR